MTTPRTRTTNPPTPSQLRYLRDLALKTGRSFAYPGTAAEASREIDRLKRAGRTPAAERRRELRQVRRDIAERRDDAVRVDQEIELVGYGSTGAWSTSVEDEIEEGRKEEAEAERAASWR